MRTFIIDKNNKILTEPETLLKHPDCPYASFNYPTDAFTQAALLRNTEILSTLIDHCNKHKIAYGHRLIPALSAATFAGNKEAQNILIENQYMTLPFAYTLALLHAKHVVG